jgi:hypothetical protein
VILATWEAEIERIEVRGQPAGSLQAKSSQVSVSKITRAKWTGDVAQAVECLLCKSKALSSEREREESRACSNSGPVFPLAQLRFAT